MTNRVLIVVDVQNDFIDGSLGSPQAQAIIDNVNRKIIDYNDCGDTIIFTQDTHHEDYLETQEGKLLPVKHCIYGTKGWKIYNDLDEDCNSRVCTNHFYVDKPTFGWKNWSSSLRGIKPGYEVELIGVCTAICVVTNALLIKTEFPEVKVTVDASCCACLNEETHKAALTVLKACQVNVINE